MCSCKLNVIGTSYDRLGYSNEKYYFENFHYKRQNGEIETSGFITLINHDLSLLTSAVLLVITM